MLDNKRDQPHDSYIKSMMSHTKVARDFFERRLPEHIKKAVDLDYLEPCKETYFNSDLKRKEVDLLFKTKIAGSEGFLRLHVEHQSTIDKTMPLRMLDYTYKIMTEYFKNHNKLPVIYSVVLYAGKRPYNAPTNLIELFEENQRELAKEMLINPCNLIDLTLADNESLKESLLSGLMEFLLKNIFTSDIYPVLSDISKELQRLEVLDIEILMTLLKYVSIVNTDNVEKIEKFIEETLIDKDKAMGTLAEHWLQQGVEKGIEKGVKKGVKKGMRLVALNMLRKNIDKTTISEVTGLSLSELLNLEGDI
ncbi:hypothetical protein NOVO_09155 (plasmid) [Rickettsiales bacterium Ac37b]|nr:hypothetical protein NOVO_09155 [Rickettsiales bacterium Ac37b]